MSPRATIPPPIINILLSSLGVGRGVGCCIGVDSKPGIIFNRFLVFVAAKDDDPLCLAGGCLIVVWIGLLGRAGGCLIATALFCKG